MLSNFNDLILKSYKLIYINKIIWRMNQFDFKCAKQINLCAFSLFDYYKNQMKNKKQANSLQLNNFARSLARNDPQVYEYILLMVKGDLKMQTTSSDFIFTHLKNIFTLEMNTNTLQYASRFVMTLLLSGNIHIYERFIIYLLPVFREKILDQFKLKMKPVWPIQLYCKELLIILATWLPFDFQEEQKPSIFVKTIQELRIHCEKFEFMNLDKIIISYRIIKSLGLSANEENCICESCKYKKHITIPILPNNNKEDTLQKMRQNLYIFQAQSKEQDFWNTGFQIQIQEQKQDSPTNNLRIFKSRNSARQLTMFNKLQEKIEVLEDDLEFLKKKCSKKSAKMITQRPSNAQFLTPSKYKYENLQDIVQTTDKTQQKRKSLADSISYRINSIKSLPNLEFLHLEHEFNYKGYDFFQKVLHLRGKDLQKFKHSLLCFDEKIYLRKSTDISVYCIALAKRDKIKIRIYFLGKKDLISNCQITLDNKILNSKISDSKNEYTVQIGEKMEPILLNLQCGELNQKIVLPIGLIKLLEPLPESAKQIQKLTYKIRKSIKLLNRYIPSYEYLVSRLAFLQNILQKTRSTKVVRLFQNQRLKKHLQRRYLLLNSEILLRIINNHTQYVDIEVSCEDTIIHRRNSCQLLKQFIFILSK